MSTPVTIGSRPMSTQCGLEVSEICLGGATWRVTHTDAPRMPQSTVDATQQILDRYYECGGNFIDVANVYQGGEAEEAVGVWLQRREQKDPAFRSKVLIATKFGIRLAPGANQRGASRNHIMQQVELSLKRLKTSYIDLYIQHCEDRSTPVEETLLALNDLVRQGRVRYLGASNFTAWHLQKAATFAQQHGLVPFVSCQLQYSLLVRNVEWEVMDVAKAEGIAIHPWSPLAGGWLTGKFSQNGQEHTQDPNSRAGWATQTSWAWRWSAQTHDNEQTWKVLDVLKRLAKKYSVHPSAVAIRWLLHQPTVSTVVIGPRTLEQLEQNLDAAKCTLTSEEVRELSAASHVPAPYPADFTREQNPVSANP